MTDLDDSLFDFAPNRAADIEHASWKDIAAAVGLSAVSYSVIAVAAGVNVGEKMVEMGRSVAHGARDMAYCALAAVSERTGE